MSAESRPIPAALFALAIQDLPLPSLFAKGSEIQNSLHHLHRSNEQLKPFADDGDADCADAIRENEEVMRRFEERLKLLKDEVEGRGAVWGHGAAEPAKDEPVVNGVNGDAGGGAGEEEEETVQTGVAATGPRTQQQSGRLTDAELQRLLMERMGEQEGDEEEGVHL